MARNKQWNVGRFTLGYKTSHDVSNFAFFALTFATGLRDIRMSFLSRIAFFGTFKVVMRRPPFCWIYSFSQQQANSPSWTSMRLDKNFDELTLLERDFLVVGCFVVLSHRPNVVIKFEHLLGERNQFNRRCSINNPRGFRLKHGYANIWLSFVYMRL